MSESRFYEFMGFDPSYAERVRGFYLPFFRDRKQVLEAACGRGEFLGLLRAEGIPALGVDLDPGMVERARSAGLEAEQGDVFEHLRAGGPRYDGIFAAHFIEHLPSERVEELFALAFEALLPGGVLVVCTPNAASIPTLQRQFWWDSTHVRMYDPELLKFMLHSAGFDQLDSGVNPLNLPGYPVEPAALTPPELTPIGFSRFRWRLARYIGLGDLERRVQVLNHHVGIVSSTLSGLIRELYAPSEIYAKGVKP